MIGWWNLAPGQCAQVYADNLNDVDDTNWFVYAVDFSDGTEWPGPYWAQVPRAAFNQCYGIGVSAGNETWEVKFRAFAKGNSDDATVNFSD